MEVKISQVVGQCEEEEEVSVVVEVGNVAASEDVVVIEEECNVVRTEGREEVEIVEGKKSIFSFQNI